MWKLKELLCRKGMGQMQMVDFSRYDDLILTNLI